LDQVNTENQSLRDNISLLQNANTQKEQLSEYWKKECERTKEEMTDWVRRNEFNNNNTNTTKKSEDSDSNNTNDNSVQPNKPILDLISFLSKKHLQVSFSSYK
jgi:hypothetical protein